MYSNILGLQISKEKFVRKNRNVVRDTNQEKLLNWLLYLSNYSIDYFIHSISEPRNVIALLDRKFKKWSFKVDFLGIVGAILDRLSIFIDAEEICKEMD